VAFNLVSRRLLKSESEQKNDIVIKKETGAVTDGSTDLCRSIREPHELCRRFIFTLLIKIVDEPLASRRFAASIAAFEDDEGTAATSGRHFSKDGDYFERITITNSKLLFFRTTDTELELCIQQGFVTGNFKT
jgi:hypothetical protein